MRVRRFFWALFLFTCVGIFAFATLVEREMPARLQVSLNQSVPKVYQEVQLTLHITDPDGVPIDNAHVALNINMTNMDMGENPYRFTLLGNGIYVAYFSFSMKGPWQIVVSAHAEAVIPLSHRLLFQVQ